MERSSGARSAASLSYVEEGGVGHQGCGTSVVQDVRRLISLVGGVDGHADGSDERQPEPAIHELGAVGEEQADAVAVADAQRLGTCRRYA